MTLVLGHISALEYWLSPPGKPSARVTSSAFELPSKAASASDVESLSALSPHTFSLPVHAMTGVTVKNERPGLIAHHLHSASTSARSFYRISDDLHVCSPELAFVQMANVLPLPDLIRLGYELCGAYSLSEQADGGFFKRRQLVSPRKLQAFVDNSAKIHGRKSALRALRHVLPNSASPAETRLAMCLSLPCNLGGFGLPRPVLNHRLNLTRSEQVIAGRSFVKCDLYWENGNLGVEYDSDREHTGSDRISSDAARRGALAFANTTVITITRRQYNNLSQMTAIAKELAKLLGVQIRPRCKDYPAKQRTLRDLLYASPEWEERRRLRPLP